MGCKSGTNFHTYDDFTLDLTSDRTGLNYQFDEERFVFNLIPRLYRKIALFKYILMPYVYLKGLYDDFIKARKRNIWEQRLSASQIVLEKYLNMIYEETDICVKSRVELINNVYIYDEKEWNEILPSKKEWIFDEDEWSGTSGITDDKKLYLNDSNITDIDEDFIVEVPQSVFNRFPDLQIKDIEAEVNKANVAPMSYEVIII